jgi:hypothetical protein
LLPATIGHIRSPRVENPTLQNKILTMSSPKDQTGPAPTGSKKPLHLKRVIPPPWKAGASDTFTALFEYYHICNAMMSSFEEYINHDTAAREFKGDRYSKTLYNHYDVMQRISDMVEERWKEFDHTRKRLRQTNEVPNECWKIPSFRSLMEGSKGITTMVNLISLHVCHINEVKFAKLRLEEVDEPDVQGHWGLEKMRMFQTGDTESKIAPWMSCVDDVRYVLEWGQVRDDGKYFYQGDKFMAMWPVDGKREHGIWSSV